MTRAAQRLNIVQPAVSSQIAKLESELGQTLFERGPKGMTPTQAGEEAYQLFAPLLDQIADARQALMGNRGQISGQVRVGLIASATNDALSSTLAYFVDQHPEVEIHVTSGFSMELVNAVRSGALDCAVINQNFSQDDLHCREIVNEELMVALGAQTRLPTENPVPLYALSGLKLVLPSRRHGLRIVIEDVLRGHSIELRPRLELDDLSVIENFLRRTDWVSILPVTLVQRGVADGGLRVHSLAAPGIHRRMICVRDRRRPMSAAEFLFIDVLSRKLTALRNAAMSYSEEPVVKGTNVEL
ncbi:DNA-binding transcriptional LysR family regulator [Saccharopolyspora phatthalungensis]|uniref:DNA-binding transcriptional LysR family regulator n=2 Tax=Saccharopolyspora phatthalungensis TaxID=664693 RepID=A0A840QEK3_9PSEU|nr:DNA-binding transcriptional LysR family regulator [Saccharopolyspora phatthalungensis]